MLKDLENILTGLNVLLVEDEQDLREIISDTISPYVKKAYEASNGKDGLEVFLTYDINLVITDINMLKMSGTKMANEIRKYNSSVPIIFLTAYDTDENILKAIKITGSNFLKKPFDKKQLITSMQMIIGTNSKDIIELKNDFTYNLKSGELFYKDELILLTKLEKRLMFLLANNANHEVSFNMIENYVWQTKGATQDTIRAYITKLRKKIYSDLIENVQGLGYMLKI